MKFVVTSALISGGAAAASNFRAEVASANAKVVDVATMKTEKVVSELRATRSVVSESSVSTQSLASSKGWLIKEDAGESTCAGPTLKLGYPMGHCYVNTTAQDSYFYSCSSNGTDIIQSMHYCSTDMTCTSCNDPFTIDTVAETACTTTGKQLWNYYAGATCTADMTPYDDYSDGWISM